LDRTDAGKGDFSANFGSFDSLNVLVIDLVTGPPAGVSLRSVQRILEAHQSHRIWTVAAGSGSLPGLRDALCHEPRLPGPHHDCPTAA
jgi:hypothetical protein